MKPVRRAAAMPAWIWIWLLPLLWCCLAPASAHTRSESFLIAEVEPGGVRLTITLPDIEAARLAPAGTRPTDARLAAYFAGHIFVKADGHDCAAGGAAQALSANQGFRRLAFLFRCGEGKSLAIRSDAFFDIVPSHVMFARIRLVREGEQKLIEQLIDNDRRVLALDGAAAGGTLQSASFLEYIALGVEHILTGPDHLAFVLGFVLISRRLRDLVMVITGFTLGHSVTLGLAVTGWLDPRPEFIDVLIALTIALIGAENFVAATGRAVAVAAGAGLLLMAMTVLKLAGPGLLPVPLLAGAALFAFCYLMMAGRIEDSARLRLVVTLVFGLIHGFAFAKDLIELQLPAGRMAELLFGFNLGVEIGQMSVVAMMVLLAAGLARLRLAPPRAIVVDVFSAALVGLGLYWLIGRTYAA
ncbi:MAG: HupE/UreJ family protein [Pseudomonadota bacterium]